MRHGFRLAAWLFLVPVLSSGTASALEPNQPAPHAKQPVNRYCPVLPEEEVDPSVTTTYQGMTIGFCCKKCLRKFEANPQRYADRLAAFQKEAAGGQDLAGGHADEEGHAHTSEANPAHEHDDHEEGELGEHEEMESGAEHHHDHGAGGSGIARLIAWFGNFHPAAVNFPIAMLVGAALSELLWIGTKRPLFTSAGRFCLWFGGLGAVAAGTLGWFFGGFHLVDKSWILTTHRWLGTSTALWALLTLIVGERAFRSTEGTRRVGYRVMLFVGAVAVVVTGFFGGAMVYGIDHYAW
jgi:uncharacterized membrane protein/YHS domain-containing protein